MFYFISFPRPWPIMPEIPDANVYQTRLGNSPRQHFNICSTQFSGNLLTEGVQTGVMAQIWSWVLCLDYQCQFKNPWSRRDCADMLDQGTVRQSLASWLELVTYTRFIFCLILGYQNQPEYANFKQLLEAPIADAQEVLLTR